MPAMTLLFGAPVRVAGSHTGRLHAIGLTAGAQVAGGAVQTGYLRPTLTFYPLDQISEDQGRLTVRPAPHALPPETLLRPHPVLDASGQTIGRLRGLRLDTTGQITHLIIQPPHDRPRALPATAVAAWQPRVRLRLAAEAVRRAPVYRSDPEIAAAVEEALARDETVHHRERPHFTVSVDHGQVTLWGHTSSAMRARQIVQRVATVPGVLAVEDRLIGDDTLTQEIAQGLAADPLTRPWAFRVHCFHGHVCLTGATADPAARDRATALAAAHPRARSVTNLIEGPNFPEEEPRPLEARVGMGVYATDGPAGTVERVIIDPTSRQVAGLLMQPTAALRLMRGQAAPVVVPRSVIGVVTEGAVFLTVDRAALAGQPRPADLTVPAADWSPPFPYQPGEVLWTTPARPAVAAVPAAA